MSAQVLVVGWDGVSWPLTQKLVAQGKMPTLDRLIRAGTAGPLRSTIPDISPTAWASFMTGKNPGKHGVYGFTIKPYGSYYLEPFSAHGHLQGKTIWRLLSQQGRRVAAMNVPMTYPPEPVNGIMLSGLGTPSLESNYTYPRELAEELNRRVGPPILDLEWTEYEQRGYLSVLEDDRKMLERHAEYALYCLKRERWDLFMVVFVNTDRLQHCLWHLLDPPTPLSSDQEEVRARVLDRYTHLDSVLAELLAAAPDASVFIMSDHGFGPSAATVQLNTWLAEQGYLRWSTKQHSLIRKLASVRRRLGLTADRARRLMRRAGMDDLKQIERFSLGVKSIDWGKTRAFSYTINGIYLNLKGRERQGTIAPGAEADNLWKEIADGLLRLRDPRTGKAVISRVARPQEIYTGGKVSLAPDLVITEWDEAFGMHCNLVPTEKIFQPSTWRTGEHRLEGILIAAGEKIQRGRRIQNSRLEDLCPTLLHLLGHPVPEDMDGRVLTELFTSTESVAVAPPSPTAETTEALSPEEQEMVFERLRALGYFE